MIAPKRLLDKRSLWPWRDLMTIGIGVLATSAGAAKEKRGPDTAILLADTLGSYDDTDSHNRLHKMMSVPSDGIFACIAGDVQRGSQLIHCISTFLREIPKGQRNFGAIEHAIAEGCHEFRMFLFQNYEYPKLRLAPHGIDPASSLTQDLKDKIQATWREFEMGCDAVVAVFDDKKRAFLLVIDDREQMAINQTFPGFAAVGSGRDNALFWLSRRQHTLGMNPLRAAYHAYEAKLTAEGSAHVNEHIDMAIATSDDYWYCSTHSPEVGKEHPEITLSTMKRFLSEYWIHDTRVIKEDTTQLNAQTSEGQQ